MRYAKLFIMILTLLAINSEYTYAQPLCATEPPCAADGCYDMSSAEAMDIMKGDLAVLGDPPYLWTVTNVGGSLRCLENCPDGDLIVSPGQFNKDSCTYKITNGAPVDMIGDCTTIVLKRKLQ